MQLNTYSELALRTNKPLPPQETIEHALMLLVSETGEIATAIKDHFIYGKPLDLLNVKEEMGDVLWGLNLLVVTAGGKFETLKTMPKGFDRPAVRQVLSINVMVGELIDVYFAHYKHAPTYFPLSIQERAESLFRMIHGLAMTLGIELTDILESNIRKLQARYGDKYSDVAALNRDLDKESKALEG